MYTLINAKRQHEETPDTFYVPTAGEIASLQEEDYVKLGFEEEGALPERMWVMITAVGEDTFEGVLRNVPCLIQSIEFGDVVTFKDIHIMNILGDVH